MGYQYSYLIAGLILLILWFILFFLRKDIRKGMLMISLIFGFIGLIVEFVYVQDWWTPSTITGTNIGIEDFIFGFAFSGIAAVIYAVIFRKKVVMKRFSKNKELKKNSGFILIVLFSLALFFGSFYLLNLNSFYSSLVALLLPAIIIWIRRKDLIISSLISGLLLMIVAFLIFILISYITPEWIYSIWSFENISKIIILTSPLEDIIWAFLAGVFICSLYGYWQGGELTGKR